MWLNQSAGQARTYVNLTSRKEEKDGKEVFIPCFRIGNKWAYQYYPNIEGRYRGITFMDKEFENTTGNVIKYRAFEMILDDKDWTAYYITGKSDSWLWRDVLNKLSSVDSLGWVSISLYNNKQGYSTSRCMNDWLDLNWKMDWDTQKTLITEKTVDLDGEKKLLKSYKKLNEAIEKNILSVTATPYEWTDGQLNDLLEPTETQAPSEPIQDDSDLPF